MKKLILSSLLPFMAIILFVAAQPFSPAVNPVQEEIDIGAPEDITALFERTCFDCHGEDGNFKAKLKLNFTNWDGFRLTKKIGKLTDIAKVLEENKMPPEDFSEENPDKALSEEEKKMMIDWANKAADELMEQ